MPIPPLHAFGPLTQIVRKWFQQPDKARPIEPIPHNVDWASLLEQGRQHGVVPILFHAVNEGLVGHVPDPVREELRVWFAGHARRSLMLVAELTRLVGLLERSGLSAIPVKGPVLAASVYGDVALRSFHDLDLLFHRDQVLAARDVLAANGYAMASTVHWPGDSAYLRSINSEFSMSNGRVSLDLHWRSFPTYYPFDLDATSVWEDLVPAKVAGRTVPSLSWEHLLLYLAAHGAKHSWSQFRWLCDFGRCVQVAPADWTRVVELGRQAGNPLVLTHALALAEEHLGVAIPEPVRGLVDDAARALAAEVWPQVAANAGEAPSATESFRFQRRLGRTAGDTLRLCCGVAIAPTEAEWRLVSLPPAAYSLYYPLRAWRLTTKYVRSRLFH